MARVSRIFGRAVAIAAVFVVGASAFATGASAQPAPAIVLHGLGARRPGARIAPRVVAFASVPASVDLRKWAVTPGDQGMVGSCVAWAIDYAMLGWYARSTGRTGWPFAPMYTYSQINGGRDEGSVPSEAFEVARTQGNDTRADYTQGDYDWRDQPTAAERANAAHYKIEGWETLFAGSGQAGNATLIKQSLAASRPVAIEMAVRNGFDRLGSSPSAVDNDVTSQIRGYHEVLAVGYDASGLLVQNSWGTGWANGGFGRISWQVVQTDVWEADRIDGLVAPPPAAPALNAAPSVTKLSAPSRTSAYVPYKLTWKATGGAGPITMYEVWLSVDGRPFVYTRLPDPTATTFTVQARMGHVYRVAVRPRAGASVGALRYSASFKPMPAHR